MRAPKISSALQGEDALLTRWNPDLLDDVLAPGISRFTDANIPDLSSEFDQSTYWMSNHFLSSATGVRYSGRGRIHLVTAILRAQLGFAAYHEARQASCEYLLGNNPLNPRVRKYFALVGEWETCVHNIHLFIDAFNLFAKPEKAYTTGDGSEEERLCLLSNDVKHLGRAAKEEHCIPMWLTNDGLVSLTSNVSYLEIAKLVRTMARFADLLQHPAGAVGYKPDTDPTLGEQGIGGIGIPP
jgi:hypothetical protein